MEQIISDIRAGLHALGIHGSGELLRVGYNRLLVKVDGRSVGIWDVGTRTFCD